LRAAGRGVNYVIGPSQAWPTLVNVAAIRSTGLSASLGIGDHVARIVGASGVRLRGERELRGDGRASSGGAWWLRAARYRGAA
jgi:glycerol-3-phosphate dehydrogenase